MAVRRLDRTRTGSRRRSKALLGLDADLQLALRRLAVERVRHVDVHDTADRGTAVADAQSDPHVAQSAVSRTAPASRRPLAVLDSSTVWRSSGWTPFETLPSKTSALRSEPNEGLAKPSRSLACQPKERSSVRAIWSRLRTSR